MEDVSEGHRFYVILEQSLHKLHDSVCGIYCKDDLSSSISVNEGDSGSGDAQGKCGRIGHSQRGILGPVDEKALKRARECWRNIKVDDVLGESVDVDFKSKRQRLFDFKAWGTNNASIRLQNVGGEKRFRGSKQRAIEKISNGHLLHGRRMRSKLSATGKLDGSNEGSLIARSTSVQVGAEYQAVVPEWTGIVQNESRIEQMGGELIRHADDMITPGPQPTATSVEDEKALYEWVSTKMPPRYLEMMSKLYHFCTRNEIIRKERQPGHRKDKDKNDAQVSRLFECIRESISLFFRIDRDSQCNSLAMDTLSSTMRFGLDSSVAHQMMKWTEEEENRFFSTLMISGKDFCAISDSVGTKTVRECVAYYYDIIKTRMLKKSRDFHANKKGYVHSPDGKFVSEQFIQSLKWLHSSLLLCKHTNRLQPEQRHRYELILKARNVRREGEWNLISVEKKLVPKVRVKGVKSSAVLASTKGTNNGMGRRVKLEEAILKETFLEYEEEKEELNFLAWNVNKTYTMGPPLGRQYGFLDEHETPPNVTLITNTILKSFHDENNISPKIVHYRGRPIDFVSLWYRVAEFGGYDQVTQCKLWRTVGLSLGAPEICGTISNKFKDVYEKNLLDFERHHPVPKVRPPLRIGRPRGTPPLRTRGTPTISRKESPS